ncbi:hypothetical protein PHYSODRAFT_307826 [Phytophthora sojae]|uniref:Uncharacterized protein n=1 Tax=Phytophthora sojae (strain P6497) TaxID=1094619 RepID=G5AG86_PHYSP|nr:hypothetical protein PHYSODRAFT_307826 [Phytophthora sojae]EGZ05598.1 hypothetical protein PHYSODRAFT_307826 [Phytophthora sojae]|eukprot:XP_009539129.1 hypothetical protein PHYSODRAFT_307826 [Phytophthora sojae]
MQSVMRAIVVRGEGTSVDLNSEYEARRRVLLHEEIVRRPDSSSQLEQVIYDNQVRNDEQIDQLGQYVAQSMDRVSTVVSEKLDARFQEVLSHSQSQVQSSVGVSFTQQMGECENRLRVGVQDSVTEIKYATNSVLQDHERKMIEAMHEIRSTTAAAIDTRISHHETDCERRWQETLQKTTDMGDERAQLFAAVQADEVETRLNGKLKTSMAIAAAECKQLHLQTELNLRSVMESSHAELEKLIETSAHDLADTLERGLQQRLDDSIRASHGELSKRIDDSSAQFAARITEAARLERTKVEGALDSRNAALEDSLQKQLRESQDELHRQMRDVKDCVSQHSARVKSHKTHIDELIHKKEAKLEVRLKEMVRQMEIKFDRRFTELAEQGQRQVSEEVTTPVVNVTIDKASDTSLISHDKTNEERCRRCTTPVTRPGDDDTSQEPVDIDMRLGVENRGGGNVDIADRDGSVLAVLLDIKNRLVSLHAATASANRTDRTSSAEASTDAASFIAESLQQETKPNGPSDLAAARRAATKATNDRAIKRAQILRRSAGIKKRQVRKSQKKE